MFKREKTKNILGLVLVALVAQGTFAFAGEELYVQERSNNIMANREKVDSGLDAAIKAIKKADPYPGMKSEAGRKTRELASLVERKGHVTATIQRLKIDLMRKRAKYARSPELLKVSVRQYSQKIAEMEDELAEIEKRIPALESKLASVTIEVEAEGLKRGIMVDEDDTEGFDVEFEEAIQGRWDVGKALLNQGF